MTEDFIRAMAEGEHDGEDARHWSRLADECIADLPAENIDEVLLPGEDAEGRYQRAKETL